MFRSATIRSSIWSWRATSRRSSTMTFAASIAAHGHGDAYFPLPEPLIQGPATRVMSLRDGAKKMSKSDTSENAYIALTDDADTIAQKIRRAKTDPEPLPSEVEGLARRPEADNLVGIFAALNDETKADVLKRFGGSPVLGVQDRARRSYDRQARADSRRDAAARGRSGPYRRCPRRWGREGARDRASEHGRDQGYPRPRAIAAREHKQI